MANQTGKKNRVTRPLQPAVLLLVTLAIAACSGGGEGGGGGPENDSVMASPSGPITINYRIIGKPIVGQSVAIDLRIASAFEDQPFNVNYRINDVTAMRLPESQPARVAVVPNMDEDATAQQVIVIPLREGRLYLNVAVEFDTGHGLMSTVTAIPIQVSGAAREPQENGTLTTSEDGAAIRSLPAQED